MAKYKSRATRLDEALGEARTLVDEHSQGLEELTKRELAEVREAISGLDTSEIEALKEEMENWRDNMDSANMTHLPKFDEVSEACDTLESGLDSMQSAIGDAEGAADADELQQVIDDLESAVSDLEGVSFPGMY